MQIIPLLDDAVGKELCKSKKIKSELEKKKCNWNEKKISIIGKNAVQIYIFYLKSTCFLPIARAFPLTEM